MVARMRHIKIILALTNKDRNRLREHGDVWHVLKTDLFNGQPAMLTESTKTGYTRWFLIENIQFEEVFS